METKTFTTLDYNELERLAKESFGIDYEFLPEEECNNDENKSYTVSQEDVDEFDEWKEWAEFLEGKERRWRAWMLITRLCAVGKIPVGNILIEVSW